MARNEQDPAASTQQFRAFASRNGGEAAKKSPNTGMIIGLVIVVVVIVAVVALLVV
ncbi:hypothetical protein [Actinoallomurus acaciae]|uniref:Uncharacterized protein n=1 Tax=Actinoallomurus acaciae TaxID=502577 RepID=A0ABV5YMZ5_9ACTN